jgi:hypothetical protein
MDESHGPDAALAFFEDFKNIGILDLAGLEVEERRDDLHIVFHPVVNLSEKDFLLSERSLESVLGFFPFRDIAGILDHASHLTGALIDERKAIKIQPPRHLAPCADLGDDFIGRPSSF